MSADNERAYHPSELPEHLKGAIADAQMDKRHDPLNALMSGQPYWNISKLEVWVALGLPVAFAIGLASGVAVMWSALAWVCR